MEPWVLPAQDAEAKKRSDSLKVTQIVREQEPRLPVSKSPVSWDQILSTCWSPGRTAWLQSSQMHCLHLEGSAWAGRPATPMQLEPQPLW